LAVGVGWVFVCLLTILLETNFLFDCWLSFENRAYPYIGQWALISKLSAPAPCVRLDTRSIVLTCWCHLAVVILLRFHKGLVYVLIRSGTCVPV
jgi:hypothetical protein